MCTLFPLQGVNKSRGSQLVPLRTGLYGYTIPICQKNYPQQTLGTLNSALPFTSRGISYDIQSEAKTPQDVFPTAQQVAGTEIDVLRTAGLSGRKAEYGVLSLSLR